MDVLPRTTMASDRSVRVDELTDDERDAWSEFVRDSTYGSAYSLGAYLEVLAKVVGGSVRTVVARQGSSIVGGVAFLERRSPLSAFVAPRLLLYYNGFVLRDYETRYPSQRAARQNEVVDAIAEQLESRRYGRLELRSRAPFTDARALRARGWTIAPSYTYVVPLGDLEGLWTRVDQNLRRLIQRARKVGIELVVDEDFESFFRLHVATGSRKDVPVYLGREAFRSYYTELHERGLCRLYHARMPDGRVAASQIVLLGHHSTHTVCAAADGELLSTGANPFLRWSVFEHLAASGYTDNDLTDASLGPVARFKGQLGGDLVMSLVARRPRSLTYIAQEPVHRLASRASRARKSR